MPNVKLKLLVGGTKIPSFQFNFARISIINFGIRSPNPY